MATRDQAIAAKTEARRRIRQLGAVVVSVGIEESPSGATVSVGVSRGYERLPSTDLEIGEVPVHVFRQRFGSLV